MVKKQAQEPDYQAEKANNERLFKEMVKTIRPDLFVLMDLLDLTGVNFYVVFQTIRALNNIAQGNKYGTVTVQIENGVVTFVKGEESMKINEELIKRRPE